MKANELRIGNWVNRQGNPHLIEEIHERMVYHKGNFISSGMNQIEPIPLTPEILEKAGFAKGHHKHELEINEFSIHYYDNSLRIFIGDSRVLLCHKCTTLHHLQNVIFSLTGSELQINLH